MQNERVDEEIVNTVTIGETKLVSTEETRNEPTAFSEKVKRRLVKKQLLLDDLGTLPVNLPLVDSIKNCFGSVSSSLRNKSNKIQIVEELINKKGSLEGIASVKLNARC